MPKIAELGTVSPMNKTGKGKFESILAGIPFGILVFDEKERLIFANPEAERLFECEFEERMDVGKQDFLDTLYGLVHSETCDSQNKCLCCILQSLIRKVLADGGEAFNCEAQHEFDRDAETMRIFLDISVRPLQRENVRYVLVVLQDVTRRRFEETKLRKRLDLLNAVSEAAMVGGWELDVDSMAGTWTDEVYRIYELPLGHKPHITDAILHYYHPDERPKISEAIRKAIEHKEPYDLETRFVTAQNRNIWVRSIGKPIIENGRTTRLVGVFQDITERKNSELQKDRLEEQLQQAMKMEAVGRLAGGVAHDFNNLLTGISGYADLLASSLNADSPLLDDVREIQNATQSAVDLAKQLLVFSRKQLIEPKVLIINDLIHGFQKMLKRLIGEDIELRTDLCQDLGAVRVDPGQFEQILVNLAVNARDAMPQGGRLLISTVNITVLEDDGRSQTDLTPGHYVMLSVGDTGCGMSEEIKSRLFEPFFTTKPKGRGTGLGLATIYGAVKQSGGSIEVVSDEGKGAAFKIYLPRVDESPQQIKADNRFAQEMPGGNETILLVEDENIVRGLAIKILRRLGYEVLHARDSERALALAQEYKDHIHILVTDVVLPGMNGRQLADRLMVIHPEMKVLYTSGYAEDSVAHHGVIEKHLNFLSKPYSPQSLANIIRELLDEPTACL